MHLELADAHHASTLHMWNGLDACKSVMDFLLSLPEDTYGTFTIRQWEILVHTILSLSRLTFLMASPLGWDAKTAR